MPIFGQLSGLELLNGKAEKKIKFRFVQGFILIEIRYANTFPLTFVFDTGAQNTIFFDRITADLGPLQYDREIKVMGADLQNVLLARIARNAIIGLDGEKSVNKDIIVLNNDVLQMQEIIGEPVHGIFGADMLKGLIVHLDYHSSVLTFSDASKFKFSKFKDYTKIKSQFYDGKPYVNGTVSIDGKDSIELKLLIDTGASISLLLHNNTHPSLKLPDNAIRGNLGRGLSGELKGFVSKTRTLDVLNFGFKNLVTFFQEYNFDFRDTVQVAKRNGIIGNLLLDRFSIYIDYLNNEVYLKPSKKYNQAFDYDRSGLVIFAHGINLKEFIVSDVLENSPAWEAGIRPQDIIRQIGYTGHENLTLERVNSILSRKAGKKICMKVMRHGRISKVTFVLKDLL